MLTMAFLLTAALHAAAADVPEFNGAFEVPEGKPQGWDSRRWGGSGTFGYVQEGRGGSWCVSIASEKGGDLSWFRRVPVKAFSRYRLSAYIKTENVTPDTGKGALINLHEGPDGASEIVTGTHDWTPVSFEFQTGPRESIMINCLFGGWGSATGKAWYDDLQLTYLGATPIDCTAEIDGAKTGVPLSKYVYGQFIEHLGRCIYGGIWAEMLEDRKFYYAVGDKESPWKPTGGPIEMVSEKPFVGEHTPRIPAGGGLMQRELGVVKGKSYEGHIVLGGAGKVNVALIWGDAKGDRDTVTISRVRPEYQSFPLRFRAGATTDDARIEITASDTVLLGTLSLMPGDNVNGMRRDTLALLKQLNAPIYRWPGGNFVSGYDWHDGIGDRDKRPPRKNPAWLGVEHNDFGVHEFMAFCKEIGTEPYITVNSGQGGAELARDEVEYLNGAPTTAMGKLRAENGHKQPWHCGYWSVGNEMYGDWQLGHMPLEEYVKKHNTFADAMRAVDPSIHIVAVGATGPWSERMLSDCATHMDFLSEHFYCGTKPGLIEHVRQIPTEVKKKADAQRQYWASVPSLKEKKVPIALDEWNYWYGPYEFGELGTRYFLQDALGIAAGLNEMSRNSDVFFMANYAQTVNVIGAIKTTKTAAAFETTGLTLQLYREHFGVTPVAVTGLFEPLDVAAAWNSGHTALTIAVVNPSSNDLTLKTNLSNIKFSDSGHVYRITGPDRMAYNHPGESPQVKIEKAPARKVRDGLQIPKESVSIFEIRAR